ncbi:hypothetical protein ACRAWF_21005 [Streptomyces sp. L7]
MEISTEHGLTSLFPSSLLTTFHFFFFFFFFFQEDVRRPRST